MVFFYSSWCSSLVATTWNVGGSWVSTLEPTGSLSCWASHLLLIDSRLSSLVSHIRSETTKVLLHGRHHHIRIHIHVKWHRTHWEAEGHTTHTTHTHHRVAVFSFLAPFVLFLGVMPVDVHVIGVKLTNIWSIFGVDQGSVSIILGIIVDEPKTSVNSGVRWIHYLATGDLPELRESLLEVLLLSGFLEAFGEQIGAVVAGEFSLT